jgi:hypothetical protein
MQKWEILEITKEKNDWGHASSGRRPSLQAKGLEFKPQYCQKQSINKNSL